MSITIIGGGTVGVSAALFLQERGIPVRIIDRGSPRDRCSFGNAGAISTSSVAPLALPGIIWKVPSMLMDPAAPLHIAPLYLPRALPWLIRFLRSARSDRAAASAKALSALFSHTFEALDQLLEISGARDLVRRNGQLHLYPDRAAYLADQQGWHMRREAGHKCLEVARDEILALEPAVASGYRQGVFLPDEWSITDPALYLQRLTDAFVLRGGEIVQADVKSAEVLGDRIVIHHATGELTDKRVLLAAGAHSARLARQLGHKVPLETQRGYHVGLPASGISVSRPVVAADRKVFVSPIGIGGELRLAGTVEFAGLDAPPTRKRALYLLAHGRALFGDIDNKDMSIWMGHRPCLPDSLPVIGRSPVFKNVFFAFGHGHLGMTGAAPTGRHVAELVAGAKPSIDLKPFSIDRF